jgi:hypothetical protein
MALPWVRTWLCTAGFVWAMSVVSFIAYQHAQHSARVEFLIQQVCAGLQPTDQPESQATTSKLLCELTQRRMISGISVDGSVDVGGTVDVSH